MQEIHVIVLPSKLPVIFACVGFSEAVQPLENLGE